MGGGGGMLRAAGRAMTRTGVANGGIQDPFASSSSSSTSSPAGNASVSHVHKQRSSSSSSGSNNLTISAASGLLLNLPVAATSGWNGGAFSFVNSGGYEDFEWVSEEEDDSLFGSVPSVDEVQDAVSALQQ